MPVAVVRREQLTYNSSKSDTIVPDRSHQPSNSHCHRVLHIKWDKTKKVPERSHAIVPEAKRRKLSGCERTSASAGNVSEELRGVDKLGMTADEIREGNKAREAESARSQRRTKPKAREAESARGRQRVKPRAWHH